MQIYLPIADLPVNVFLVLGMGLAVGYIPGMFGIGGGFLMTPLLIFIGISPAVAVATVSSHIAASSFTGAISYWRRRALDIALAMMLLSAGIVGTATGVWLFTELRALDQLEQEEKRLRELKAAAPGDFSNLDAQLVWTPLGPAPIGEGQTFGVPRDNH